MSRQPVLVEARPLDGGVELVYEICEERASVLTRGRVIEFPHSRCSSGESLGDHRLDEAVRLAAREEVARFEGARLWRRG